MDKKFISAKHLVKFIIVALIMLIRQMEIYAENFPYTNGISVSGSTLYYGASCSVDDGLPSNRTYGVTRGIVTLGIDWGVTGFNNTFHVDSSYIAEIIVNIKGWDTSVVTPSGANYTTNVTETLTVIYHPLQNVTEIDRAIYTCLDVRKITATITAITINGIPVTSSSAVLPEHLYLTTDLEIERYRLFGGGAPTMSSIDDLGNNQFQVSWSAVIGVEEYDLEWTWVDAMAYPQTYSFVNNCSRVTIPSSSGTSYIIPAAYPSGTIVVRVRGRGRDLTSYPFTQTTFGSWSLASSGTVSGVGSSSKEVISSGLESSKNWQFTTTFSEQGKRQDIIKYFDGTLRNRQSISRVNILDTAAVVGETYYDYIGRPAIQILPVPDIDDDTSYNHIGYRTLFNRDINDDQFTFDDFDTNGVGSCQELVVNKLSNDYGSGRYYSEENPLINSSPGNFNNYIPKANGYPYTQVEYMPDNTNRIRRQGGVGVTHRLTGIDVNDTSYTGKETMYYYGTPFQEQLDRLFGNEVGIYKHYKKNLVIDANGQISVSYLDPQGRVIATALAGNPETTPNLLSLPGADDTVSLSVNLLDSMDINYSERSLISTTTHLVSSPGTHSIAYTVATPSYQTCLPNDWCFDCIYDLTISVKNECGEEMIEDGPVTERVGTINTICDSITFNTSPSPLDVYLGTPGNYIITKRLTVNDSALAYYTQLFLNSNTCILPLDSFIADAMNDIDTTQCYGDCEDCLDRLGAYSEHSDTNKIYDPTYDYMTQAEYDRAVEECNARCDTKTPCDILYMQILNDVSPGGQYMTFELSGSTYSVTDSLSLLNISYGQLGNYAELTNYENPDGSNSVVIIDGDSYYPQDLSVGMFVEHWENSWAEVLAPYHPEYCYYQRCLSNEDSYLYDMNMMLTETYEAAQDSGFLNPITSYPDTNDFRYEHLDPYFAPYSGSLYTQMADALEDYVGIDTTAWELVLGMQNLGSSNYNGSECWTDYDWQTFRAIYLSLKQEILSNSYDTMANCVDWRNYPNDAFLLGLKLPRFVHNAFDGLANDALTGFDIQSDQNSSPQEVSDEALEFIEGWCDTLCTEYADQWMYELRLCGGMSSADSLEIRNRFISTCRGNCDGSHPFGGIEQAQVDDILTDVLGSGYSNDTCNAMNITQPVNGIYSALGFVPMDSCACNKAYTAQVMFDTASYTGTLPAGICNEQDMFEYLYGEDAQMVNFSQLLCYCNQQGLIPLDTISACYWPSPPQTPPSQVCSTFYYPPTIDDCDMYLNYYGASDTLTANDYLAQLVDFFNQHWEKDSCAEDTFYLENLSLPIPFLGSSDDCFMTYSTENTFAVDTVYIYRQAGPPIFYEHDERLDSIVHNGDTYYIYDTSYVSLLEYQTITFHNPCGDDCQMIISAPPCLEGNLYWADYLYCDNNFQVYWPYASQDSVSNDCTGGYYAPFGPGLYSLLAGYAPNQGGFTDGKYVIWTNCFSIEDTVIVISSFDTTMYVPYGLACEQCLTCAFIDTAYNHMMDDFPFVENLTDTFAIVTYLNDYINNTYGYNFTPTQLVDQLIQCDTSQAPGLLEFCYEPMFTVQHDEHQECVDFLISIALSNAESEYQAYLDSVSSAFKAAYVEKCLSAFETFTMDYTEREYHYTLYYYDQAGNLIKTVPPAGVEIITNANDLDTVILHRQTPWLYPAQYPAHEQITNYRYTTLNQPSRQHTPDGGITQYWYDILGRLVVSQNAKQFANDKYSYTKYDDLGRIVEVGEIQHDTAMTPAHAANAFYLANWIDDGDKSQITTTYYDETPITGLPFSNGVQKNLRNRVAFTTFKEEYDADTTVYDVATHYSYDIHGNVTELVQDVVALETAGSRYKLIKYEFDLISGKVLEVKYQEGEKDQFYHRYEYSHDNKLIKAKTSNNYVQWDEDATYEYYMHGPLSRTELGDNQVQGVDYAYTIHGWIKGINSNTLNALRDIGKDGYDPSSGSNPHEQFNIDVASYTLGYYSATNGSSVNDYQSIASFSSSRHFFSSIDTIANVISNHQYSLFNGNISHMVTAIPNCSTFTASQTFSADPLGTVYRYDQLNRIKQMQAFADRAFMVTNNYWDNTPTNGGETYHTNYQYDANGNLLKLGRWGDDTDSLEMDSLTYGYVTSADPYYSGQVINQLDTIGEHQTGYTRYNNDIDNSSYYDYDEVGNLIEDTGEEIDNIEWTVYGKVKRVIRATGSTKPDLEFAYNASGQRYMKLVKPRNSSGVVNQSKWKYTYYWHDAQGNVMSIYTLDYEKVDPTEYNGLLKLQSHIMYGSSRLGMKTDTVLLSKIQVVVGNWNTDSTWNSSFDTLYLPNVDSNHMARITGYKNYEISNHLGNVLSTVTDRKVPIPEGNDTIVDYWTSDINTLTDYYPFGSPMPGRNLSLTECTSISQLDTFVVVNEQFASGTGGFTAVGRAKVSNSGSGTLTIQYTGGVLGGGTGWGGERKFSHINGVQYTVKFYLDLGTCTGKTITCNILNPSGTNLYSANYTANGTYTFNFTANATGNGKIQFLMASTANCKFNIDSVVITYPYEQVITDCDSDSNSYLFGFNGQMKDNEVYGEGNSYTAEFWQYDPRIGRRWNVDPMTGKYPGQSPYAAFNNCPISTSDPKGLEGEGGPGDGKGAKKVEGSASSLCRKVGSKPGVGVETAESKSSNNTTSNSSVSQNAPSNVSSSESNGTTNTNASVVLVSGSGTASSSETAKLPEGVNDEDLLVGKANLSRTLSLFSVIGVVEQVYQDGREKYQYLFTGVGAMQVEGNASSQFAKDKLKGGKQKTRDREIKQYPIEFQRWYHKDYKEPGDPDATKDELKDLFQVWKDLGKPITK